MSLKRRCFALRNCSCISQILLHISGSMTVIKQGIKTLDMKGEVRGIRKSAQKIAVSKAGARRFLVATGIYSASGEINPKFR